MPASVGRVVTAAARVLQRKETSTSWVARNFVSDARHRSRRELIPVIVIYIAGNSGSAVENGRRVRLLSRKLPKRDREGGERRGGGREAFAAETMNSRETNLPPPLLPF